MDDFMLKFIFINLFVIFAFNLYGLNIYTYNSDNSIGFDIVENTNIVSYKDVINYLEKRYEYYDLNIIADEIKITDLKGNELMFLDVNILINLPIYEIYNGPAHSSIILDEILINLVQPGYSIPAEYKNIYGLIVRLNGIFLNQIENDMIYETIITRKMYDNVWFEITGK
jgi:hypothetical protein